MKHLIICLYRAFWIFPLRTILLISVRNYSDLYGVALWEIRQLKRFGQVSMISAPLFSGGCGSLNDNLRILQKYIRHHSRKGGIIWSQVPYLDLRVKKWAIHIDIRTSEKIQKFYVPLIKSKEIASLLCVRSDEDSNVAYADSLGCQTEREAAEHVGISVQTTFISALH